MKKYNIMTDTLITFLKNKIIYLQEIIQKTFYSIQTNHLNGIFSSNDTNVSTSILYKLYKNINEISTNINNDNIDKNAIINDTQRIIDKLSVVICGFGTKSICDLLFIVFGSEWKNKSYSDEILHDKFTLIQNHITPIGYKIIHWKKKSNIVDTKEYCADKITDTTIQMEDYNDLECYDMEIDTENLLSRIHGVRILFQNVQTKKTLVVYGIVDYLSIDIFTNKYITNRLTTINEFHTNREKDELLILREFINNFVLKDILIYGNNDILKKIFSIITDIHSIKQSKLDVSMKKFIEMDIYTRRQFLLHLLCYENDNEVQYICSLLYELLQLEDNTTHMKYYMLPYHVQSKMKTLISNSSKKTNDLVKQYDISQVTLEQQIYLMKATSQVKEKALLKLKEIKGKPDDVTLKTKQYLEGLLRIPFGIYREEPILKQMKIINNSFKLHIHNFQQLFPNYTFTDKNNYTSMEICKEVKDISAHVVKHINTTIQVDLQKLKTKEINKIIQYAQKLCKDSNVSFMFSNKTKSVNIEQLTHYIQNTRSNSHKFLLYEKARGDQFKLDLSLRQFNNISNELTSLTNNMNSIKTVMNKSIHGHTYAKNQIMKIIGQWINGEMTGYCFGFEGSPGIGKTSLAKKGISKCLQNENSDPRPFTFISVGGSCNGSTLEGHSYTYQNSTWGRIVDLLMESNCMNPIIYVDELDKISKTEQGKEIIGIFTHLIDTTQNEGFQDKYFSGVDIDMSKALFIFSYNDPDQIDRVLLDRIHRIHFENLTLDEKVVIVNEYILPEINTKMGFDNIVQLNNNEITYIIENYTLEPGVRKLKEILFDLYGEINLEMLENKNHTSIPIKLTETMIDEYLKKYNKINHKIIHNDNEVGVINGLWANTLGQGGIIPIQCMLCPSNSLFELQLTGLQGNVMKESMNVAKTLAWNLTPDENKSDIVKKVKETNTQGLHIHCPEGAISKDGPSAGAAITLSIFSLFNNKQIKNDVAITGEINLQGQITKIGGLDCKIAGGIKAGVKTFLFPQSNVPDFIKWKKSLQNQDIIQDIHFKEVSNIHETFSYVFSND